MSPLKKGGYKGLGVFRSREKRHELAQYALELCIWLHQQNPEYVILCGEYSEDAFKFLKEFWKQKYKGEKFPAEVMIPSHQVSANGVEDYMKNNYPKILQRLRNGENPLVFEAMYWTDYPMRYMKNQLKRIGAKEIKTAALLVHEHYHPHT